MGHEGRGRGRRSTPVKFKDPCQQAYLTTAIIPADIIWERPVGSWDSMSKKALVFKLARHVVDFCDWLSDPPMTERDRITRYIVETRIAFYQRYLARR